VSHDRTFLRGLSNRVLIVDGENGTVTKYPGPYEAWVESAGCEAPGVRR
jgi:ATPase subunit of ABC transporter with duplicated ATPase domains